jgi:Flp pilus assembly protein TadG
MTRLHKARAWLDRHFLAREDGMTAVEFVLTFPLFMFFLFTSIEFGTVMVRQVMLDRAVDMAVRQIRLGNIGSDGLQALREEICSETIMIGNCLGSLTIEMRPIDTGSFAGLNDRIRCMDRAQDVNPAVAFNAGAGEQELMLVKVCVVVDPFFPTSGWALGLDTDESNGYALVALSAFVNEPR